MELQYTQKSFEKYIKFLIFLMVGIFIIVFIIIFFQNIISPSYRSYQASCAPEKFEKTNYIVSGSATYDTETKNITIEITPTGKNEIDIKTLKHELIHANQFKRKFWFSFDCKYPIQKMFVEMEAYAGAKLSNKIFERIYNVQLSNYTNMSTF